MFFRNMLADFGSRFANSNHSNNFIPYFKYEVGAYRNDYNLYFPKEPFAARYKNEIFNKLKEYSGYDVMLYLEFHYVAYPDKERFLRFLQYEVFERMRLNVSASLRLKLQTVAECIKEKQQDRETLQLRDLKV